MRYNVPCIALRGSPPGRVGWNGSAAVSCALRPRPRPLPWHCPWPQPQRRLGQGKGAEVYITSDVGGTSLEGVSFSDAFAHFPRATPLGIVAGGGVGGVELNPPQERTLAADDRLIVLAKDERGARAQGRSSRGAADSAVSAAELELLREPIAAARPTKVVMLGDGPEAVDLLRLIDEVAAPGSSVAVVAESPSAALASVVTKHVSLRLEAADPVDPEALARAGVASANSVVLVQQGEGSSEEDDSSALLRLQAVHTRFIKYKEV